MCDEQVQSLQTTLHSCATGVPILLLQRVEDSDPAVMESMVSVLRTKSNFIILFCCFYVGRGAKFYGKIYFNFAFFILFGYRWLYKQFLVCLCCGSK
jgi:hypothetical protein